MILDHSLAAATDEEVSGILTSVPIQSEAAYFGVIPSNQMSYLASVVPVLPPTSTPEIAAFVPVPPFTTDLSIVTMIYATPSSRTLCCFFSVDRIVRPSLSTTLVYTLFSTLTPPLGNVAYASAIS